MENILKDNTKFEKVDKKTRTLNFQINHEKRNNQILQSLKSAGSFSDKQYKKTKAVGSRPGVLCGLCKVHKAIAVYLPFRPILSAIGTATYKIVIVIIKVSSTYTELPDY